MSIRKAQMSDLPRIEEIYAYARAQMKKAGNPEQWGDDKPGEETLINDIRASISHVLEEEGKIYGVFVFFTGEDPDYRVIEDGEWKNDFPYGVIHRVASDGSRKGILEQIIMYCTSIIPNLRMDTHHDNRIMQYVLEKNGFERCGIVYVEGGNCRIAYQKVCMGK